MTTIFRPIQRAWTLANEAWLGISTMPAEDVRARLPERPAEQTHFDDARGYSSADYFYLWTICRLISPTPQDVIFDLGCGMGRFLCVAAQWQCSTCVGVELSAQLCQVARRNALRLRRRKSRIEIIHSDVANVPLTEGTVYYLFNPFGPDTLSDVTDRIASSLASVPRPLTIVYHNAVHREVFDRQPWLVEDRAYTTFGRQQIVLWRTT